MEGYSTYVFIVVIMSSVGYMATNTRNFNIWKMGLIAFIAAPIVMNLKHSETAIWVAIISFFAGFMLPHAHMLDGFFRAISGAINSIRYRDERRHIESQKEELRQKEEELRRREVELERLRREYEEAMWRARSSQNSHGGDRTRQQSGSGRQERSRAGADNSSTNRGRPNNPQRAKHLEILGLDPDNKYSSEEIGKRVRQLAAKYHPDKHHGKSEDEIRKFTEKMKDVNAAAAWFTQNPDE